MSVVRCDDCSRQIDSDFDLECFTNNGTVCEPCRAKQQRMETMKYEVALFRYTGSKMGFLTVWHREAGKSGEHANYVRISEWVPVEFPMLPGDVVAEANAREIAATRARLQQQLADLDAGVTK